jgi:hypothetical protein
MINRIVRMSFDPERAADFLELFQKTQPMIAGFEGCKGVKLLKDLHSGHVFFTYSLWESEDALEHYRRSPLFETTWAQTKQWFNDRPMAWSLEEQIF